MSSRCCIKLVLLCVVAVSSTTSAAQGLGGGAMGGFTSITDLDDEHLQDIAKYAVTEYNQKAGTNLEYLKIDRGDCQVVAGNNYRLVISTNDAGTVRIFQAIVNDRPWQMSRELISFDAI